MNPETVRVLHIEDDLLQQALVARHLTTLHEYRVVICHAAGEQAAIDAFRRSRYDLVIADYYLTDGDGLSCLRRIREIDPIVPIITVSGEATVEVAAQLIDAGADDYLGKQTLNSEALGQSVRNVLVRAQAFRARVTAASATSRAECTTGAARQD